MKNMKNVRPATPRDASRLAEILVFTKRITYRDIFRDDAFSFGELQVLPLALEYQDRPEKLSSVWVYDDGLVKGMMHIDLESGELCELYVEPFFQGQGVGKALMEHAIAMNQKMGNRILNLWVLQQNSHACAFYEAFGFAKASAEKYVDGTNVTELQYHLPMTRI